MKVNLENMYSPCRTCYTIGRTYSLEDPVCSRCEYAISMELLHCVLGIDSECNFCSKYDCCAATADKCQWQIDWKKAFESFSLEDII